MIFNQMRRASASIIDSIYKHPFNDELSKGTLSLEQFIFYIEQDALYLADFSRALALIAAKLPCNRQAQQCLELALEAIQAEKDLHCIYLNRYQTYNEAESNQNPSCFIYTNYLLKMASLAPLEVAAASLLPCFFIYQEVGKRMISTLKPGNPYEEWITLYSGSSFEASVNAFIQIVDCLATVASDVTREKMIAAFLRASQLEWLFWEGAYNQERWKEF